MEVMGFGFLEVCSGWI